MIVADAGLIVALVSRHKWTEEAEMAMELEPEWMVPPLWRAEVRNVLAKRVRLEKGLTRRQAIDAYEDALALFEATTQEIEPGKAMKRTLDLGISGYDAEYLELAELRGCRLVSTDQRLVNHLLSKRVRTAILLSDFVNSR